MQKSLPFRRVADCNLIHPENDGFHKPKLSGCPSLWCVYCEPRRSGVRQIWTANRTSARAVRDLKHFIEFAERGPRALAEAVQGSVGGFDSPFEAAVAEALTNKGWQVVTQIGVSRFRLDLGIVHPDRPGDYLVGVECDGAAYHSAATARDRDKVRQAILEGLGWKLLRVWSTDWWVDKASATEKLHRAMTTLLETDRNHRAMLLEMEAAD
jgi:very-short-patch-repair endonuclease